MRDQTALVLALRHAGHTPDEIAGLLDGWVWLGDLAGMEIAPSDRDGITMAHPGLTLFHRACTPGWDQLEDGMSGDGACMLANLVERAITARDAHTCSRWGGS